MSNGLNSLNMLMNIMPGPNDENNWLWLVLFGAGIALVGAGFYFSDKINIMQIKLNPVVKNGKKDMITGNNYEKANAAQEASMSKEDVVKWDKLMMCASKASLEDLIDNILITEERMGISDRTLSDYWKYVAKYVMSLYDEHAVDDRYKRLEKFKEDYDRNVRIEKSNKAVTDFINIQKEPKNLEEEQAKIKEEMKTETKFGVDAVEELGKSTQSYFIQTVPDSQSFSELEQIKESLRILKMGYIIAPKPRNDNAIYSNWPPISIEHMQIGLDNTIKSGYKMVLKSQLEEQDIVNEEVRQLNEWLADLNVPKKQMGKEGQEYSLMGRIIQLLNMVQMDFQNITSSGIIEGMNCYGKE